MRAVHGDSPVVMETECHKPVPIDGDMVTKANISADNLKVSMSSALPRWQQ
jgi:hypothetical protein